MIKKLIKEHATGELTGNTLNCRGTEVAQIGDILADSLLLLPKRTKYGNVCLGVYWQAEKIYKDFKDRLFELDNIKLTGHSLGGGSAVLIAYMLRQDGYINPISISTIGALKVLSSKVQMYIQPRVWEVECRINHKDIVPHLGFWRHPIHNTPKEGEKRKHIFDWDFSTHLSY